MTALVVGGAASGKSQLAEQLILQSTARPRVYIATMQVWDGESERRVQKHRAMRAEKQFSTLEVPLGLLAAAESVPPGSAVLLEDLTNLCAGEMFSPQGAGENTAKAILAGVKALAEKCALLVIVSGDVAGGGLDYAGDTPSYVYTLAKLNNAAAALITPSASTGTPASAPPRNAPHMPAISKPPTAASTPNGSARLSRLICNALRTAAFLRTRPSSERPAPRPTRASGRALSNAHSTHAAVVVLPMPISPVAISFTPSPASPCTSRMPARMPRAACSRLMAGPSVQSLVPFAMRRFKTPGSPA